MDRILSRKMIVASIFLILAYGSTILFPTLWSDDYVAIEDTSSLSMSLFRDLRPIWAVLNLLLFSSISFPSSLVIAKFASLLFLILTFRTISKMISHSHGAKKIFFYLFLVSFTLPSFSITIHWLVFWQNSAALFISSMSLKLFFSSNSFRSGILSFLLFLFSFSIYPPSAFWCFGLLAIFIRFNLLEYRIPRFRLLIFFFVTLGSSCVSVTLSSLLLRFFHLAPNSRVSLLELGAVPEKLFYLAKLLILPFNLFSVTRPTEQIHYFVTIFCLLVFLLNATLYLIRDRQLSVSSNGLLADLIALLSFFPLIITSDNQLELRLIPGYAFYITVCILFFITSNLQALVGILESSFKRKRHFPIVSFVLISVLAIGLVTSQLRFFNFFRYQYVQANNFIVETLSDCNSKGNTKSIRIININDRDYAKRIGIYSMKTDFASSWVPEPALSMNIETAKEKFLFEQETESDKRARVCEVNFNSLQKEMTLRFLW